MHTNWICAYCGSKIRFWILLCKECKKRKDHSFAILCQNKKKLKLLLDESSITIDWLDKFVLYTDNIIANWKVLIDFKRNDEIKVFDKLMKHLKNKK